MSFQHRTLHYTFTTDVRTLNLGPVALQALKEEVAVLLQVGAVSLVDVLDEETIPLEEVLVRVAERVTGLTDADGLEHTGVAELLQRHEAVEEIGLLLRVGLDAPVATTTQLMH